MSDPNLDALTELADLYAEQKAAATRTSMQIFPLIKALKEHGYSYKQLSKATGMSVAGIQRIVAK